MNGWSSKREVERQPTAKEKRELTKQIALAAADRLELLLKTGIIQDVDAFLLSRATAGKLVEVLRAAAAAIR